MEQIKVGNLAVTIHKDCITIVDCDTGIMTGAHRKTHVVEFSGNADDPVQLTARLYSCARLGMVDNVKSRAQPTENRLAAIHEIRTSLFNTDADVIWVRGDVASGKTTLAKSLFVDLACGHSVALIGQDPREPAVYGVTYTDLGGYGAQYSTHTFSALRSRRFEHIIVDDPHGWPNGEGHVVSLACNNVSSHQAGKVIVFSVDNPPPFARRTKLIDLPSFRRPPPPTTK